MLLEIALELHGEPLVPKVRPGYKQNYKIRLSLPPFWTVLGYFSVGNLENALKFSISRGCLQCGMLSIVGSFCVCVCVFLTSIAVVGQW